MADKVSIGVLVSGGGTTLQNFFDEILGSNWDKFKRYKSIKFYRLDSTEGQKIFKKMNFSKEQIFEQEQPRLF